MEKKNLFLLIGLFWLIIIIVLVAVKEYTLQTGQEVLLRTVPVDPRDLFRGDYVILRYEISRMPAQSTPLISDILRPGKTVYVPLGVEEGYGVNTGGFSFNPPEEGLFIKGKIVSFNDGEITVEYGIESYFVPEGKGKDIERKRPDVKVSIDKFGNAVIKALLIDGEEVVFES